MTIRRSLPAALTLATLAWSGMVSAEPAPRPNIIFILTDDLGWGDLGIFGHPEIRTPNLDRIARQGTVFTQFYVAATVCSPSRAAFLTGRFPSRLGIHSTIEGDPAVNQSQGVPDWLDPTIPILTRLLRDSGYATALFGKWHLGQMLGAPPLEEYGIDEHRTLAGPRGGPTWVETSAFRAESTQAIVDEAIRFIDAHRDRPFFLNVWTLLPHATLAPNDAQMNAYSAYKSSYPWTGRSTKEVYYPSVTEVDDALGRLVARVDELDLTRETLIVFASDNGPEEISIGPALHSGIGSSGPFRGRKRSLYEGGIRSPLIVRWPGHVPSGRVDSTSVLSAVDLFPTLLSLAGVAPPAGVSLDGEDVTGILYGQSRARTKRLMWEWRFKVFGDPVDRSPMLAIRDGKWKLLMNPNRSRLELYDVTVDPTEVDNLAAAHPAIVEDLSNRILQWSQSLPPGPMNPNAGKNDYPWPVSQTQPDGDGDGWIDSLDRCPQDPHKHLAGVCGCGVPDLDSDGDQTADCIDGCPGDPGRDAPGICGCGVAETDTDQDGMPDCVDGCPADPLRAAPGPCGCGVMELDSDDDGTLDCQDGCPTDPLRTAPGPCGCNAAAGDADEDGVLDCEDRCPLDNPDDSDFDGVCDSADVCAGADDLDEVDGDGVPECADNCPGVMNLTQSDADGDGAGDACDCAVFDPTVWPDAAEINDAQDNQCPGAPGYGSVDETSGNSGFHHPRPLQHRYSWPPQAGATLYEVARSSSSRFESCVLVVREAYWDDTGTPPRGTTFYYLNRPSAPFAGSWGSDSSGVERAPCPRRGG